MFLCCCHLSHSQLTVAARLCCRSVDKYTVNNFTSNLAFEFVSCMWPKDWFVVTKLKVLRAYKFYWKKIGFSCCSSELESGKCDNLNATFPIL